MGKVESAFKKIIENDELLKKYGTVEHLFELAIAESEGKLLILPCKIGDTVYCIYTGMSGKNHTIMQNVFDYSMIPFFGKSVFLNKEEAEAKLKELENNGLQ